MARLVAIDVADDVATLTLDRPSSLNALDYATIEALVGAIDEVARLAPRVVVLRGAGRSFCSGGDVAAMQAHRDDLPGFIGRMIDAFHGAILALRRLDAPVIASLRGAVAGGGFSLALACDLAIASTDTRFVVAYPLLGASSDGGLSFQLAHKLGPTRALELLTIGGRLDAARALSLGLVNQVVDDGALEDATRAMANALIAIAPQSVIEMKRLVAAQSLPALEQQLDRERAAFVRCAATSDFQARVAAFVARS
ncbi:MAG: enoyl-CoA hydratase [Rhizobacter sp.]|nr:enoyl-CoA hydratase [Rhizobacter sp.]